MSIRQFCNPHVILDSGAMPLRRLGLNAERGFNEEWFQQVLFANPQLLPIGEIEPVFDGPIGVAREMPTEVGPVDLVYINPEGYITIVETKLWRNPEARREVVAQIIDYATAISKWSYQRLCEAVSRAGAPGSDPLVHLMRDRPEFDERRFVDTVTRSLSRGQFLLLVVGDGLREGVEHLSDTLSRSPNLRFALSLVEIGLFKLDEGSGQLFVQPRVLARTTEVVRAVVDIRVTSGAVPPEVQVSIPKVEETEAGARRKMSEELFLEEIERTTSKSIAAGLREFLAEAAKMGVEAVHGDSSLSLKWYPPNSERSFRFGFINTDGELDTRFVLHHCQKLGISEAVGLRHVEAIASLVPGAQVVLWNRGRARQIRLGSHLIDLPHLLPLRDRWLDAIRATMGEVERSMAELGTL